MRRLFAGLVLATALGPVLAACAGSDDTGSSSDPSTTTVPEPIFTGEATADLAILIAEAGFGCEDFAAAGNAAKLTVEDSGECTVISAQSESGTERARIDVYADQEQMDVAIQSVRDMGFGVTTIAACDLWSVSVDTEQTATAMAGALGCIQLS